ncbi:MAG: MFS transporter [Gammaproteobacteria bacterium]
MDVIDISIDGARIQIRLDWDGAPETCRYFCNAIKNGTLDPACVFRILDERNQLHSPEPPISVIQIGCLEGLDAPRTQIAHETTDRSGRAHQKWTVSAARYDPGELYASFFICMRDEPELDFGGQRNPDGQGFCAFGEVIAGFDTLQQLHAQAGEDELLIPPKPIEAIALLPLKANTTKTTTMNNTNTPPAARPVGEWFEDMPLTRAHWLAGFTLFVAFVIESWEMMIIVFSSGAIAADFNLDSTQTGSLISAMFLGMIPGSLMWGKLIGTLGRKHSLLISIGLYGIFPLLSAFSTSFEMLWVVRFLCGVVLSGALVVTFPYFEELVPVHVRGKATVYLSAGWPVGVLVAIGVTTLLLDQSWRYVVGAGTLVSLWALCVYYFVPESPYWLATKGRTDEADAALRRLSMDTIEPRSASGANEPNAQMAFSGIFASSTLRITLIQTIINFCFSWGYWGLASWMPTLLAERGLSTPAGLGFMALSALFMFPGYISASYFTGRFGRKKVMLAYVLISTLAGFGFAYSQTLTQMYVWNFTLSFFSLGAWGVWNTWLGEIYDTQNRGAGTAWGVMAQRVANSIAPIAIGAILVTSSFVQTVAFIALFLAITFVASLFLPETEGKALA